MLLSIIFWIIYDYLHIYAAIRRMCTTLKALTPLKKTGDPEELRPLLLRLWWHQHPRRGHCCWKAGGNDGGCGGRRETWRGFLGVQTRIIKQVPANQRDIFGEMLDCKTMERCWTAGDIFLCICKISGISKVILPAVFFPGRRTSVSPNCPGGEDRVQPPAFRMVPDQASFVRAAATRWENISLVNVLERFNDFNGTGWDGLDGVSPKRGPTFFRSLG